MQILRSALLLTLTLILIVGCRKQKPKPPEPPVQQVVDLTAARFADFVFEQRAYEGIELIHPQLTNGEETTMGEIRIAMPSGSSLQLSPRSDNFTNNDFTVTPALGTVQDFSNGPVLYTITSKQDAAKKVHYRVVVTRLPQTIPMPPSITELRLDKSLNPQLPNDVSASLIEAQTAGLSKIYVFVPLGTSFTNLHTTVAFSGAELLYTQDETASGTQINTPYPAGGLQIDYGYPKKFFLLVKRAPFSRMYEVIIDVPNPARVLEGNVAAPDVVFGTTGSTQVTTLINQGNRPLHFGAPTHTNAQPSGSTALRASVSVPTGGILPGNTTPVHLTLNGTSNPPGIYSATAQFLPKISIDDAATAFRQPTVLNLSGKIVN